MLLFLIREETLTRIRTPNVSIPPPLPKATLLKQRKKEPPLSFLY